MTAIEWYHQNHLIEIGADYKVDWKTIQDEMQNERMMRDKLAEILKTTVVELADPTLGIYATVLDAATLDGRIVFEFKCCRQGLTDFDRGAHGGVAVQVHKIRAMRNACGNGSWLKDSNVAPFKDAWYVYWDGAARLAYLALSEIEELIKTYPGAKSLSNSQRNGLHDNNVPAYSFPSKLWHDLGWMPRRPFTMDDIIAGRHSAYLT